MKTAIIAVAITLLVTNGLTSGQSFAQANSTKDPAAPVLGVWRAEMNGLPAFDLVVSDESGPLTGAIVFYLQKRVDVNHPYRATPGLPAPILNPIFDGKTLTFQVSHRGAHPPRTLSDPPVSFALTLDQDGKAQLVNKNEFGPITLTHSDY